MSTTTVEKRSNESAPARGERTRPGRVYTPNVDIIESKDALTLIADVPGVAHDSIQVSFEDGELELRAAVAPRLPPKAQWLVAEYETGDYYRRFEVSDSIDATAITAQYKDGVLRLTLPKSKAALPRKISVTSA